MGMINMNIFVLDKCPQLCAAYHCDKHVLKMLVEYTQILSTISRLNGIDAGYKITHPNRKCVKWAGESLDNYKWLFQLVLELEQEYIKRYKKPSHKSTFVAVSLGYPDLPVKGLTPFVFDVKGHEDCVVEDDIIQSYRNYYMNHKREMKTWRNGKPDWWE
jgi:hypothetical protein